MSYLNYQDKLEKLIGLFGTRPTISPLDFEMKLQCTEQEIRDMVNHLRTLGYDIQWSTMLCSYILMDEADRPLR